MTNCGVTGGFSPFVPVGGTFLMDGVRIGGAIMDDIADGVDLLAGVDLLGGAIRADKGSLLTVLVVFVDDVSFLSSFFVTGVVGGGAKGLATSAGSMPGKIQVFKSLS